MEINLTKKQANTLFVILILFVIVSLTVIMYYIITYKEAFISNPLSYGVKKMNLGQCTLTCYSEGNYEPKFYQINSTSFSQDLKGGLIFNLET